MFSIAHDLEDAVKKTVREVGLPKLVVVERSPDWPGELIFQAANAQGFYETYGDWISRYMVLNQLFSLKNFYDLITSDGHGVVFHPNTAQVLERFESWDEPIAVDGFSCPGGKDLYPFQQFTLRRALERSTARNPAGRFFFCNWCTGSGKSLFAQAGAQELFNRDQIDLVIAFTEMGSKLNLAFDALASFTNTTTLTTIVNDGTKLKRIRGYQQPAQVIVANYEKAKHDEEELLELVRGRRVLWVLDEASKVIKASGRRTYTRQSLTRLIRKSHAIVWPMDASVVDYSPQRYRDVYNLSGARDADNPLGTAREFQTRYAGWSTLTAASFEGEWNRGRLQEIRHRVADRTQAVRKTDPDVRPYFKGMRPEVVPIHMSEQDRRLYDMVLADARGVVAAARNSPEDGPPQILGHYRLLRYICNTPEALTVTRDELGMELAAEHPDLITSKHCAKLEFFLDQVEQIASQGDKVLAFSHFTRVGMLLLTPHVAARGIRHVVYYGVGMKAKERQEALLRFKRDPAVTLFLASDAAKRGLNLPEARYVINYEVPYSYDTLMQRSERINRADSELEGMTSYIYITKDTVEERIWEENERRRLISQATQGTVETLNYGVPRSEESNLEYLIFGKTPD